VPAERSATRELAQAGLQVWQALSERAGRDAGTVEAAIMFTELTGFSAWALEVGDELGLELLRAVASVVEPAIGAHSGRVVKRLGQGHMAVFLSAHDGVDAGLEIIDRIAGVEVSGYRPQLGIGLHLGHPRRLGRDLLGTDVNVAARLGEAAVPGELLVSDAVIEAIDERRLEPLIIRRRRGFRAKGAPSGLGVFRVCVAD
jgi:adenylate cyclase